MKLIKILISYIIAFTIFSVAAQSQSIKINISDTTINRGGVNRININFDSDITFGGIFYSEYTFNANVIDIKPWNPDLPKNEFVEYIELTTDLSDLKNSVLKVKIKFKQEVILKSYFVIEIEGLAGADTVTMLTPVKASLDSTNINLQNTRAGRITVRSSSVVPGIIEGLGQNRPNPFFSSTIFPFGLNVDSGISFSVYGLGGRKILDDDNITEIFKVSISNENGEITYDYKDKVFKRGNYELSLEPFSWQLASGTYFIVMKTESGTYKTNFMYIK